MKKYVVYLFVAGFIACFASCAPAYVVRERPAEVVYVRPAPPSANHIWITGDWVWVGGRYEWREGHYERRREGYHWQDGHWQEAHGGYKWAPGHWQAY